MAARLGALAEPERGPSRGFVAPVLDVARSGVARFLLLCALVEGAVLLGTVTLLPAAMEGAGASTSVAGLATGVYGLSVLLSSQVVGRLSQRWAEPRLLALGAVAAVLACGVLARSQGVPAAVAGAVLLGAAWASMHSTLQTWATEVLPRARATVVSFFAGSLFVGSSLAAVVASGLADAGRYDVLFVAAAVAAVPLGLAAATVRGRWRPPAPGPAGP